MKRRTILFFGLLIMAVTLKAQTFQWAKSMGGTAQDVGNSISVDASGNTYTAGVFNGTADFDPGAGTFNLTSAGLTDIFVQKMDASGNFLWAKSIGGMAHDLVRAVTVDALGNIYIAGAFQSTADFDPGAGTTNLTPVGGADIFVQKMDASGNFLWAKSFGGPYFDEGYSISVDASGNIYTTGYFAGTVDFDPGAGTENLISLMDLSDVFVQKMDALGNFLWVKSFGGTGYDDGNSISIDGSGNIYVAGDFQGTADFDPGPGVSNLTSTGHSDIFVQKMDASGNFLWAKSFGTKTYFSDYYAISADMSGNVYTIGYFEKTTDFDPGAGVFNLTPTGYSDIFVQKMDASGNFLWAKSFGGTEYDVGVSIIVDALGNVYTAGSFGGSADFDPGPGVSNLTSAGRSDIFVQKMDASGNFLWVESFGGTDTDIARSLAIDASGNLYTTGHFEKVIDFDPGAGMINLTSAGGADVFVHKMSQTTNINQIENNIDVAISPNPSAETIQVLLQQTVNDVELTLSDVQGKLISTQFYNALKTASIELRGAKGIYFLTIKTKQSQQVFRLVKE